ncbi:MAG TPA: hypothetical protein VFS43_09990 [Polyangiaceae bacterium]|nr:hypothetical protein [Polyangiaceae bacterium]
MDAAKTSAGRGGLPLGTEDKVRATELKKNAEKKVRLLFLVVPLPQKSTGTFSGAPNPLPKKYAG